MCMFAASSAEEHMLVRLCRFDVVWKFLFTYTSGTSEPQKPCCPGLPLLAVVSLPLQSVRKEHEISYYAVVDY